MVFELILFLPLEEFFKVIPLSPYILIIYMEVLSLMIHRAIENQEWSPFRMGRKRVPISHILFADDILLFGQVNHLNIASLQSIPESFCLISDQTISIEKNRVLFSQHTPHSDRLFFCNFMAIKESFDINPYQSWIPHLHLPS